MNVSLWVNKDLHITRKLVRLDYQNFETSKQTNTRIVIMTYRFNYLNATEKRQAQKEQGRNNIPECDGQVKHPEHLWRHDHLQILQREALRGNVEKCREMILELPEYQRKDMTEMMIKSVAEVGRKLDLWNILFEQWLCWKKMFVLIGGSHLRLNLFIVTNNVLFVKWT